MKIKVALRDGMAEIKAEEIKIKGCKLRFFCHKAIIVYFKADPKNNKSKPVILQSDWQYDVTEYSSGYGLFSSQVIESKKQAKEALIEFLKSHSEKEIKRVILKTMKESKVKYPMNP